MVIEVTSVPDRRRTAFGRRFIRLAILLLIIASAIGADVLVRSYTYYSQIIDARLASGYLTSRPGLYAAPRTLERGEKLRKDNLIQVLRRAGYVDSLESNIWNGSFRETKSTIEITPGATNGNKPDVVTVLFKD